ncbi:hypothetical protein JMJ35_002312 [Cladonia borealis]|uniref:DUF6590 domain-containing protein n=1 Tax=Cladonia borealis TaxID=184061 RepID=A0AA39V3Q8_9LECA|nr:hypothetical protein JMJ35_002312 [Cladonia borealis]
MDSTLVWKRKNSNGLAWRKGAAPNTPALQRAASSRFSNSAWPPKRTSPEPSRSPESQELNSHGKPLRRELAKHRYRLGTIVRAPLHEEDYSGGNCESYPLETRALMKAKTITESPVGGVIHTKFRKFIVVALFDDHYLAVPLYSYKGDGLIEKKADEYISIQDHRAETIKPQSRHGLLYTGNLETHVDHYEPMTSAHFAYPVSRKYKLPVVYEGELRADSTKLLLRLYGASMLGGAELNSLVCPSSIEEDFQQDMSDMRWFSSTQALFPGKGIGFQGPRRGWTEAEYLTS